jgi:methionyl-tRNA formyltransferase
MAEAGSSLMLDTLRGIAAGMLPSRPQNHAEATYAPLLKKEDGRIEWAHRADGIYNRMRGFTPWPGSYTTFRGRTCHILGEPAPNVSHGPYSPPGTSRLTNTELLVSCGHATELHVLSVKQDGGKKIDALEFASGARLTEGERFGKT